MKTLLPKEFSNREKVDVGEFISTAVMTWSGSSDGLRKAEMSILFVILDGRWLLRMRVVCYRGRSIKWTEPRFLYAYCRSSHRCRACFVSLGYRGDLLFTIRNRTIELGFLNLYKMYNILD